MSATKQGDWDDLEPGLLVGPLEYDSSESSIRAYCDALEISDSGYLRPEDGPAAMPPTLHATAYSALLRPHLDLGYGLMSRHSMKVRRTVPPNETVSIKGRVVEKFERKGRHYWTLQYDVIDAAGNVCIENRVTCSTD